MWRRGWGIDERAGIHNIVIASEARQSSALAKLDSGVRRNDVIVMKEAPR
jgi:hypothetical protein